MDQAVNNYDSIDWRASRDEKLLSWLCGDADAVAFVVNLSTIIEIWDDLIDGDRKPSDAEIHNAFLLALFDMQANTFFSRHKTHLLPLIMTSINAWLDSVDMERGRDRHERMWAFFLKDYGRELFIQCAFLAGGYNHMRSVSMEMRRHFTHETYETWEHRHA